MAQTIIGRWTLPGKPRFEVRLLSPEVKKLEKPDTDVVLPLELRIEDARYKNGVKVKRFRFNLTLDQLTVEKPPNLSKLLWQRVTRKELGNWAVRCLQGQV
ncbi:MAG TPA: hypothetical protein VGP72_31970 [Planctomycetota bacterium]|jgi:hypothetical protein